ncbi:hypothetical protein N2W54_000292 [Lotmaria passim]
MRKLGFRRESMELPLPAGGAIGAAHHRRSKRKGSLTLFLTLAAITIFLVVGLASLFGSSTFDAMRRAHGAARLALTAEEEQVAEHVRTEALKRRQQQWSKAPPPPTVTVPLTIDVVTTAAATAEVETMPTSTVTRTDMPSTTVSQTGETPTTASRLPAPAASDPSVIRLRQMGDYTVEEPERLPGLQLRRRRFSPEELLEEFNTVDYIYSFANGSEANHQYRKEVRKDCLTAVLQAENESYMAGYPTLWTSTSTTTAESQRSLTQQAEGVQTTTAAYVMTAQGTFNPFTVLHCLPKFMQGVGNPLVTLGDFREKVDGAAAKGADNRDRETDELRHSIRSLEQHVRWHRGRVVIVSPGHHPTWVDGAKNFLAGACGDASVQALRLRGTHLRLTTVHQDAVMPYGLRFTADSHVIEQHIWRVRNITPVHVYMNDDYFVNRDVAITDLFNEYGGTIVRTEGGQLPSGRVGDHTASWAKGAANTQQFNIMELDVKREDELPESLIQMWSALRRVNTPTGAAGALPTIAVPSLDETVDVAHHFPPERMPAQPLKPRRVRHYATHAPFVYCTNMFRFFETRYEREFANASLHHRGRKARDLFIPFLYNAFVMARPWQASPQFLPYLLQLHRSRNATPTEAPPSVEISLDNFDGCAPALSLVGESKNDCKFGKFSEDAKENSRTIARIASANPLYFNINAGFSSDAAASQLREFLHDKFPTPIYLEQSSPSTTADPEVAGAGGDGENAATTTAANAVADAVLTPTFDALMALPVVGVVSYEEGACPLVRSLWLAFAGHHRGRVHVAVQRHGLGEAGEADESLRETRRRLGHRVFSAIPVPKCAFGSLVSVGPANRTEALADVALRALRESGGAGVELPSTCGHSGDNDAAAAGAGLRVRGFVIDARTPSAPVKSVGALRDALAMPGQTLALEDFRAVRVGPEDRDVVLVLAREDADAKAVHWITGASENDLLVTYPLPVEAYENMTAELQWSEP